MTIPSSQLRTQRPRGVTQPKVARRMRGTAGPGRARAAEDFWGQYSPSPKGPVRDPAPAAPAVACFVEELGHLRGLPAAGLATHDDDGVLGHRLHDHLLFRENRELQPLFLPETGSQCSGTSVGGGVCVRVSPAERPQGRGDFAQTRQDYVGRRGFCRAGSWHVDCTEARGARCVRWRTEARTAGEGARGYGPAGTDTGRVLGAQERRPWGQPGRCRGGLRCGNCQLLLVGGGVYV